MAEKINSTLGFLKKRIVRYFDVLLKLENFRRVSMIRRKIYHYLPVSRKVHNFLSQRRIMNISKKRIPLAKETAHTHFLTTIPHATTGIGHAFAEWNTGRIIANYCGLPFVHISLPNEWEKYLNLQESGISLAEITSNTNLKIITLPLFDYNKCNPCLEIKQIINNISLNSPVLFILADGQNLYNHNVYLSDLREIYLRYHKPTLNSKLDKKLYQDNEKKDCINIAVHIRRGDIVNMMINNQSNWQERYLDIDYFDNILGMLTEILNGYKFAINIYSQGNDDDFQKLMKYGNVNFFINYDQFESLNDMVFSDILIMSPSGFSYLAGILSKGFKIARYPWWHEIPAQEDWYRVVGESTTNFNELKSHLLSFIQDKFMFLPISLE